MRFFLNNVEVALLLALVMVLATLPMGVFGQAVRAGTVLNPRVNVPNNIQYDHLNGVPRGSDQAFRFRIDAAAFSNLSPETHVNAVLDFALSGGANSNAVGFASSAALEFVFTAGPGLEVGGGTAGNAAFLATLNSVANNTSARTMSGDAATPWRENEDDLEAGRPFRHVNILGNRSGGEWANVDRSARRAMVNLFANAPGDQFNQTIEGFVDVTVAGIRAANPEAHIEIAVRTGGGVVQPVARQVLYAPLVGDWHNGVNVSSVSVVPMSGIAQLSGIRITEAMVGRLVAVPAEDVPGGQGSFVVRLVAPRGFVWDTGAIAGVVAHDLVTSVNSTVMSPVDVENNGVIARPSLVRTNIATGQANPFINTSTDRSELFVTVQHEGRRAGFVARTTPAEFTLRGLTLIPVRGAASSGDLSVDVYVGSISGGGDTWSSGALLSSRTNPDTNVPLDRVFPMGTFWSELMEHPNNYKQLNVVVATLDADGDIEVISPDSPANVTSGRLSNGELLTTRQNLGATTFNNIAIAGNARWMNGANHTIRIQETVPGTMFRNLDTFELRPVQEGVRIVDAEVRAGRDGNNNAAFPTGGWTNFDNNNYFVSALTDFSGDSLIFAPRTMDAEDESRLRRMDIRLLVSIEAGFEARHGEQVEVEVFRNGVSMGVAHIANATDLVTMTGGAPTIITRNMFDVLGLTPVSNFTISETEAGNLRSGYTIMLGLRSIQNGREVTIPMGEMELFLGAVEFNEAESGLVIEAVRGAAVPTFRVVRSSSDVPGVITFTDVNLAGPTVPNVEWHVFAYGPEISPNSNLVILPPTVVNSPADNPTNSPAGYRSFWEQRAIFYGMPYSAQVLDVQGQAVIEGPGAGAPGQGAGTVTTSFTLATLDREGHSALHFEQIGGFNVSMFGARM
ncbi:MAG: hypothetical protein FWB80_11125, partial [Defluviitaleaceae bacterium]|nr:hypothetical protein [Defluviitaleaceae bacterium]